MDHAIGIVVDHKRSMAAGKVEIGCFRAYTNDFAAKNKGGDVDFGNLTMISSEKFNDFGPHAHRYYKVPHSFYKNKLDEELLAKIWSSYWI